MSFEVGTGFEPVLTDLQSVASPLGQPTVEAKGLLRADDEARTRDLNLGKVALYQLSYVRLQLPGLPVGAIRTISDASPSTNSCPVRVAEPRPQLGSGHAGMGERTAPRPPRRTGAEHPRPRIHRGRRGVRGDQGRRQRAVRAHPAPAPDAAQRGRAWVARPRPGRRTTGDHGGAGRRTDRPRAAAELAGSP